MTVYGIKNCNTVKNALAWLDKKKIAYTFHDYKTKGITKSVLNAWAAKVGWETLLNRKGMTWRQLTDKERASVTGKASAIELMIKKPTLIKRPVIANDSAVLAVGFDEATYKSVFT